MAYTECPPDVEPGDIVRCRSLAGVRPDSPLGGQHLHRPRANEGLGDAEPLQRSRVPVLHLAGIPGEYATPVRAGGTPQRAAVQEAHETAGLMARVMRECANTSGACTEHDLARAGFTAAQILEFADAARGIAGPLAEQVAA